jgi:hypothetical protein
MISLRRILRGPEQSVRSLAVQASEPVVAKENTVFEVLTRHLLLRLVHNEALGEEMPTRIMQTAYMFALPGALFALYLFAAYHQPRAVGPRPFWLQISDHYFYTVYAFVVMGVVTLFEWDLLFPDLVDVFVLTTLPIPKRKLLLARLLALAIFLALVLAGTNFLGALFFPAVADLHRMWWHHLTAHIITVVMAGSFVAAFVVALQGGLLCLLGRKLCGWISPLVQTCSLVVLLTILFLLPLSGRLQPLLESGSMAVRLFPPFWFLGLYERLLWGAAALPVFSPLAKTAVLGTACAVTLAVVTYPLAYARRVKQLVEGNTASCSRNGIAHVLRGVLHVTLLRSPQQRAIYHFISQTLIRLQRLRLYLSIYAGVGLSLAISGLLVLHIHEGRISLEISEWGVRATVPILVFLITIGLRTAFNAPVGLQGSWVFRVIHGKPIREHLQAVFLWAGVCVGAVTVSSVVVLHAVAPVSLRGLLPFVTQLLVAVGLSILLGDIFLLRTYDTPFTVTRTPLTTDLPISFVRYAVVFPAFVAYVVSREEWIEASVLHMAVIAALFGIAHGALAHLHRRYLADHDADPIANEAILLHRLGLQE